MLKLQLSGAASLPNGVCADFRYGLPSVVAGRFGPTSGCRGCRMVMLPLWNERGGRGRYSNLSRDSPAAT
jgi:hypothetical protein